jgi:carbamoyl-phosphate synthase large subunit
MKKILVTAIGGDIAQGVATIVRESRRDWYVLGTDMAERHGGNLFVDAFYKVPAASDGSYVPALKALIEREGIGIVIPISPAELVVVSQAAHEFDRLTDTKWITPGPEAVAIGTDKLVTARRLEELGLPVPWTVPVSAGMPREYPCIVKRRVGWGSREVFIVRDERDAEYWSGRYPDAVYQELLEAADREVTCAVYRTVDGRVAVLQLLRHLVGGVTGWARVICDEAIERTCRTIAEGLKLRGSMNVQLRITPSGPRVFEINPRFSSTALMRHRLGFTDVVWAVDEAEGKGVEFPEISVGAVVVRTQDAAVLNGGS